MSNATLEFGKALSADESDENISKWISAMLTNMAAQQWHAPLYYTTAPAIAPAVPDFVPPAWEEEYAAERLAELAFETATYIESHGWTQGEYQDRHGRVCAMGALSRVLREAHEPGNRAYEALTAEATRTVGYSIPHWNDRLGRTADDVIDMWLEVAATFEARALV